MIIQELFKKADIENVFFAYLLIRPVFDDLDSHTLQEKTIALKKLREHITDTCNQIATCDIDMLTAPHTLFVIGRTRTEWGETHIQDLECFSIKDEEAIEAVKKDFTLWNDKGDVRLDFYGVDFVPLTGLAGYHMATSSLLEQGVDICCAVILHDLFLWGFTEETRNKSYEELINRLDDAESDIKNQNPLSFEEFLADLDKEYIDTLTEDEKEHYHLEREYQKKVEDIENRHFENIINNDHQRFLDIVRNEYSGRIR